MAPPSPPALGLVYPGDSRDPRSQSGRPFHLAAALEALGCRVIRLRAAPPAPVQRVVMGVLRRTVGDNRANLGSEVAWLRTRALARRAARLDPALPMILIGSFAAPPPGRRFATYDDMTLDQVERTLDEYPVWADLPARVRHGRRAAQARLYRDAVGCGVTSGWTGRSVVADYGVEPDRVHVVGLGTNGIVGAGDRDWSHPRFLFVGREWGRKNGAAVVRAFAHVRARHPGATLDLVGEHPRQSGEGIVDHGVLAMDDPAARARLQGLYARATCFVVPSRHEPTGIVFAEAASAGLPMIGSSRGGTADVIGDAGVVVEPDDDAALRRAMLELADPAQARRLGERARERGALFTWDAVARRFLTLFGLAAAAGIEPAPGLPLGDSASAGG